MAIVFRFWPCATSCKGKSEQCSLFVVFYKLEGEAWQWRFLGLLLTRMNLEILGFCFLICFLLDMFFFESSNILYINYIPTFEF